jgi:hypothetical protein
MLDPARKVYRDARAEAGIPGDWSCLQTAVSPDGRHVWMSGWEGSYLVDLTAFTSRYYPDQIYWDVDWAPSSKFALLYNSDPMDKADEYSVLSVADKELKPLPAAPLSESHHWWHPTDDILLYRSEDKNTVLLDMATMSYRELPFRVQTLVWSPSGGEIAFVEEDGSLWQLDYPVFANLRQLTPSLPHVDALNWSPDGTSLSFVSGSDIYVVESTK